MKNCRFELIVKYGVKIERKYIKIGLRFLGIF